MASDSIVKNVVEYIVSQIVEDTKSVKVDVADSDDENVTIEVRTAPEDMGRVIGKRGRGSKSYSYCSSSSCRRRRFAINYRIY